MGRAYLDRSELESSSSVELHVAFSRPITNSKKSQYVQDLLWENRNRVWQLIDQVAHIFVCGDGRHMAKDVDAKLCKIVAAESRKINEKDAINFLEELQNKGR